MIISLKIKYFIKIIKILIINKIKFNNNTVLNLFCIINIVYFFFIHHSSFICPHPNIYVYLCFFPLLSTIVAFSIPIQSDCSSYHLYFPSLNDPLDSLCLIFLSLPSLHATFRISNITPTHLFSIIC